MSLIFKLSSVVLLLTSILLIFFTSMRVRYWADDFCFAATYDNHGFWGSLRFWWESWTGRYSYIFFFNLANVFGKTIINVLPIIIFLALIASTFLIIKGRFKDKLTAVVLSALFTVITLVNAPNIIQSFYWQTGILIYVLPISFLHLYFALFFYQKHKLPLHAPFMLTIISGGFSEVFAVVQLCLLSLIFSLFLINKKNEYLRFAMAGLMGTAVALFVMFVSPGNEARASTVTQPESVGFIIRSTILTTKWYLVRMIGIPSFVYSAMILISGVMLFFKPTKLVRRKAFISIFLSMSTVVLLTLGVMASGYYSMAYIPPERALFVVFYGVLVCMLIAAMIIRSQINHRYKHIYLIVFFLSSIALTVNTYTHWSAVYTEVNTYARKWDVEEQKILSNIASNRMNFEVDYIYPVGSLDGFLENEGWVTSCMEGYYKVENIKVIE